MHGMTDAELQESREVKRKKKIGWDFAENVLERNSLIPKHYDVLPNPPLGYRGNPIKEVTPEIKSGYGWVGNEKIMENWIVLLASFSSLRPWRQIPARGHFPTSKVQTRRWDLLLAPDYSIYRFYKNFPCPLILTELKSNYIDDEDVTVSCLAKAYPQTALSHFANRFNFKTLVFQMVSPAGITETGVQRLNEVQEIISKEYDIQIVLDAVPLEFMVWHQIYPAILQTYRDEKGAIGQQFSFVKEDVEQLCEELCNPTLWVNDVKKLRERFRTSLTKKTYLIPHNIQRQFEQTLRDYDSENLLSSSQSISQQLSLF
jgi:hypothetical protein